MKLRAAAAILLAACTVPTATRVDPDAPDQPDAPIIDAHVDATVDASPDAMLTAAMLSGQPSTDAAFGDVVVGQTSGAQSYTISNDGDEASGAIAIAFDASGLGFAIANDTCSGVPLDGHHSCTFQVTFAPPSPGAAATMLRVTAGPGGEIDRGVGGNGLTPGAIDLIEHGFDFGDQGVDAGAVTHTFDVTNGGGVTIGVPTIAIGGATDAYFLASTTCTAPLAPNAHCAVVVRFDPSTVGDKPGSLTLTSSPGGSDAASLSGTGVAHVTVTRAGTGTGTVASNQPGIDCGTTCDADFASTPVTLNATAAIGTTFAGWSGDCTGAGSCTLDLTGAKHVTATFTAITPALTVSKLGNGAGTIVSSPSGIACGATCAASFTYAAVVTLTATPSAGSSFGGWGGACAGSGTTCTVTMDQARSVTADFDAITPPLVVTLAGSGAGSVTSKPDGIACAPSCSATYSYGTVVMLTAAPATGVGFTGWSGACTGTNPTCTVTLDQERDVTATFDAITPTLTVIRGGTQGGAVTSAPSGISCGTACSAQFAYATVVTLSASANVGQTFTSWSGACTGTSTTCTVAMDQARTVTATFAAFTPTLTVTRAGTGTGTVASADATIACGATCSHAYSFGDTVMLTATAATGSTFTGWSGACAGTAATCTVTMNQAQNAIATFDALTPEVDVSLAGTGTGAVSSSPSGISCGSSCSATFAFGTSVTLTAVANTGSTFASWGGACAGITTATCTVVADRARAVSAQFDAVTPALTVALQGNGAGSVTSAPTGITCGSQCSASFPYAANVTLTPSATTGSAFTGWGGACSGTGACVVSMTAARSVTATFTLDTITLTYGTTGNGPGALALSPAGASCGAGCAQYDYGTTVVLTATAGTGASFTGWSGDCSSSTQASCTLAMTAARGATASFTLVKEPITVNVVGSGTVTPTPAGAPCGSGCSSYDYGTSVTLTEAAAAGYTFAGWSGSACNGSTSPTCTVTADQARSITATFTVNIYDLILNSAGAGAGQVTLAPGGNSCGSGCTAYPYGTVVTLTASANPGSTFAGWSGTGAGSCAGQITACTLTIDQQRAVTATFTLNNENLTVTTGGNGAGSVSFSVAGASCGSNCQSYAYGTSITLTANVGLGSTFAGWTGDVATCTTALTCTVVMDRPRNVTATFTLVSEKLTWGPTGAGTGTIAVNPAGTTCGAGCSNYDYGTSVTLTATPQVGSTFGGWSGACTNATGACTVSMTQAQSVTARFDQVQVQLTWSNPGNGSGNVAFAPAGTSCGANCATFAYGTQVVLTESPSVGSTFGSWGGACSGTGSTCALTMNSAQNATATFTLVTEQLSYSLGGNGSGTIGASPAGTSCGATCIAFNYGQLVTLTASPSVGSTFTGWSGACTNATGTCTVTMTSAQSVTATFALVPEQLTYSLGGNGSGTIGASPAGTSCGGGCLSFNYGATVTLTANPSPGSTFTGWSGACTNATGTCTVTMSSAQNVTASFTLVPEQLTWSLAGNGAGTISATPSGTSCGASCLSFNYGTTVTLTANPSPGSSFTGWSGACTNSTGTCTVTMSSAQNVTASFALVPETLTWSTTGNGAGTITTSPAGSSCGTGCLSFNYGTSVTVTPSPATGSSFSSWGGACSGTGACVVSMTAARNVTVGYALNSYTITVTAPTGGTISSTPGGISCPGACSASFLYGTSISLSETATPGYTFSGWGGACSGSSTTCPLVVTGNATVTASYTAITPTLTVTRAGNGSGTVTDNAGKINCGGACSGTYSYAQVVTLTASPAAGSTFTGWGGACSGTGQCQVSMTMAQGVIANFALNTYAVNLTFAGDSGGTVTINGTPCSANCSAGFLYGTTITLSASPNGGAVLASWSGACTGTGTTCTFTLGGTANVTAEFDRSTYTLTAVRGTGTLSSSPAGITGCKSPTGGTCAASFARGTTVTVSLLPKCSIGWSLDTVTWSGCDSDDGGTNCYVGMFSDRSVSASYTCVCDTCSK